MNIHRCVAALTVLAYVAAFVYLPRIRRPMLWIACPPAMLIATYWWARRAFVAMLAFAAGSWLAIVTR